MCVDELWGRMRIFSPCLHDFSQFAPTVQKRARSAVTDSEWHVWPVMDRRRVLWVFPALSTPLGTKQVKILDGWREMLMLTVGSFGAVHLIEIQSPYCGSRCSSFDNSDMIQRLYEIYCILCTNLMYSVVFCHHYVSHHAGSLYQSPKLIFCCCITKLYRSLAINLLL